MDSIVPVPLRLAIKSLPKQGAQQLRNLVATSLAVQFNDDPLFPTEMSRLLSSASSVVKRHGRLIEADVAYTLERSNVLVKRNEQLPITRGALQAVAEGRSLCDGGQEIPFNADDLAGTFEIDILAIDKDNGWACAISSKRGGGSTESQKRKEHESNLRALDLVLLSQLRAKYPTLRKARVVVLDYLGRSGFSEEITLRRSEIDAFFGLPMVKALDETTRSLRKAIKDEFGPLMALAMNTLSPERDAEDTNPADPANGTYASPSF